MKAADIRDDEILLAIDDAGDAHLREGRNYPWVNRWEVEQSLPAVPPKVVLAKLRRLLHRGLLNGCACGCRGDFYLTDAGRGLLERPPRWECPICSTMALEVRECCVYACPLGIGPQATSGAAESR